MPESTSHRRGELFCDVGQTSERDDVLVVRRDAVALQRLGENLLRQPTAVRFNCEIRSGRT